MYQHRKVERNKSGYILLELLIICAMLLFVSTSSIYYGSNWRESTYRFSVRLAANTFVTDIRKLQEDAMYSTKKGLILKVSATNDTYCYYEGIKLVQTISLARQGYPDVYFAQSLSSLQFSSQGAPTSSNSYSYILRHRQLKNFGCAIKIDSVTGRVSIIEIK